MLAKILSLETSNRHIRSLRNLSGPSDPEPLDLPEKPQKQLLFPALSKTSLAIIKASISYILYLLCIKVYKEMLKIQVLYAFLPIH